MSCQKSINRHDAAVHFKNPVSMKYRNLLIKVVVRFIACVISVLIFSIEFSSANNLQVSNVSIVNRNTDLNFALVRFSISWENSWRVSNGPANWDAVWIFIKYRVKTQPTWKHASLNWINGTGVADGHSVPTNAVIASSNDKGSGGSYGAFIYSSIDLPQSNVNYNNVELRWNYGIDGVNDNDHLEICVLGIEMVRVPQNDFFLGDGSTNITGQFHDASDNMLPFHVTGESAITLGGSAVGSLGSNNSTNMFEGDDFNNAVTGTLPASFPKGFSAFYCMKYEITQLQYAAFLNKLNYFQQKTRTKLETPPESAAGTNVLTFFGFPFRNGIVIQNPGANTGTVATYACDLNANGIYNEINDGLDIACNNISWADITAYLDWAALRPITELEYEKACRGSLPPVADEYAWGNTSLGIVSGKINDGMSNETSSDPNANCNITDWTPMDGPIRVGSLGMGLNSRTTSGATYYGIMEMTGNVWERTVSIGNTAGRSFDGRHGDGVVSSIFILGLINIGDSNVPNWPDNTAAGSGFRGSAWSFFDPQTGCISNRFYATSAQSFPTLSYGGRGVRTVPY